MARGTAAAAHAEHARLLRAVWSWARAAQHSAAGRRQRSELARWHRQRGAAHALRRWAAAAAAAAAADLAQRASAALALQRRERQTRCLMRLERLHVMLATRAALRRWQRHHRPAAAASLLARSVARALARRAVRRAALRWAQRAHSAVVARRAADGAVAACLRGALVGWATECRRRRPGDAAARRRFRAPPSPRAATRRSTTAALLRWRRLWEACELCGAAWRAAAAHGAWRRKRQAFWAMWQQALMRAAALRLCQRGLEARRRRRLGAAVARWARWWRALGAGARQLAAVRVC